MAEENSSSGHIIFIIIAVIIIALIILLVVKGGNLFTDLTGIPVGSCPQAAKPGDPIPFEDAASGNCYTCPIGYVRSGAAIGAPNACSTNCKGVTPTSFPSGTDCWECPPNYTRTGNPIGGTQACQETGGCATKFPGSFEDGVSGACYTCPGGFNRNGFIPISANDACASRASSQSVATFDGTITFPESCPTKFPNSFENVLSGRCYTCPPSAPQRNGDPFSAITSANACIGPAVAGATKVGDILQLTSATNIGAAVSISTPAGKVKS